jgi:predicted transcriptional regulator of viral defense system
MDTKSSAALRYLESHEVFTLEEYLLTVDETVTERTRYSNLQNALRRGQAYRIRRGLYASNLGVYRDRVPNVFLVAAKTVSDAVITHHSALEAHGVAHTPFRTVCFSCTQKVADFEVRGYRFRRVPPPNFAHGLQSGEWVARVRVGEVIVPASSKERTLVDCVSDLALAGGIEELLRSLGGLTSVSGHKVAEYAGLAGSPTVAARVGWCLELFAEQWRIDDAVLERLRGVVGRGTYRLLPASDPRPVEFVAKWRLYVPAGLPYGEWTRG